MSSFWRRPCMAVTRRPSLESRPMSCWALRRATKNFSMRSWTGWAFTTTRAASSRMRARSDFWAEAVFSGTEIESNSPGGRDPYTRFRAAMPTEGPVTDAGLEVWPRGMYDLVSKISREYNHPIIEITESGCGYLDAPDEEQNGRIPDGRSEE